MAMVQPLVSTQIDRLRRGLLGFMAVLLGVWLPFVCWGVWADPSSPHAGPHLVFSAPPAWPDHADGLHGAARGAHQGGHASQERAPTGPTGPARPATSLLGLFILNLPAILSFVPTAPQRIRWRRAMGAAQVCLTVPTPPPRG